MTAQQQNKKMSNRLNVNSGIMALLIPTLIWFGNKQVAMYNAYVRQPDIDRAQNIRADVQQNILSEVRVTAGLADKRSEHNDGRLNYVEGILEDKLNIKFRNR